LRNAIFEEGSGHRTITTTATENMTHDNPIHDNNPEEDTHSESDRDDRIGDDRDVGLGHRVKSYYYSFDKFVICVPSVDFVSIIGCRPRAGGH